MSCSPTRFAGVLSAILQPELRLEAVFGTSEGQGHNRCSRDHTAAVPCTAPPRIALETVVGLVGRC